MATLRDGLGFEELGDTTGTGDTGSKVAAIWLTGSIVTQNAIYAGSTISGAGGIVGLNISGIGSVLDGKGQLRSAIAGSPLNYGALVQAGSSVTDAGSGGVIKFGTPFKNTKWVAVLTPGSTAPGQGSEAYISGIRNAAWGSFIGGASIEYDWIAVGL